MLLPAHHHAPSHLLSLGTPERLAVAKAYVAAAQDHPALRAYLTARAGDILSVPDRVWPGVAPAYVDALAMWERP